jgi:lipopolysaccharide export system protein LptA
MANHFAVAQSTIIQPVQSDTIRLIQILKGNSLREKYIDTVSFQTIAGDVLLRESLTLFNCDSAAINKTTNVMEAFGNIHINQNDSIHTYSQYLKYIGQERVAYLKKNVKLTDKKGTLYTEELEYNLNSNIGIYKKGGRVVNGKTVLTSEEGTYYADTKDVYFKKNVRLVDPKYTIDTDSLLYNTQSQVVTFITQTKIKNKDGGEVYTSSGTYDLKNGKAFFGSRTVFKDSTRTYVADNSAIDEATGNAQLEGNAVIRDSVNGYTVLGGQIFLNRNNNSFLATRKPVLIFKGDGNDSTFVAADTLFSGIMKKDSAGSTSLVATDTLKETVIIENGSDSLRAADSSTLHTLPYPADTLQKTIPVRSGPPGKKGKAFIKNDLPGPLPAAPVAAHTESVVTKAAVIPQLPDTLGKRTDSSLLNGAVPPQLDTTISMLATDTTAMDVIADRNEKLQQDTSINIAKDTAIRYFQAFHNVRIFNDSLQAVCDSLFYSSEDSVFRLYQEPLVFSNKSQIAGDTIHLYTKNKKPERVYVFENGIIINELNKQMYNQMAGRTLNGYFKDGTLDYMRVKGSPAESVFYPQDDDSAITGMNRCSGDVIDIYFVDKTVNKVKFVNNVDGVLYPISQVPEDQKKLAKFQWLDARRPKNKLELFE